MNAMLAFDSKMLGLPCRESHQVLLVIASNNYTAASSDQFSFGLLPLETLFGRITFVRANSSVVGY